MTDQQAEPLTPEEIEDIRVRGSNLALVDPRFYSLWDVINRLLATLDAAREQRDRWEAEARHQFDLRDDAARTASVAGLYRDVVSGLNDAARTLIEQLDRHGIGNLAPFEQQVAHLRGHLLSDAMLAAPSIEQEPGEMAAISASGRPNLAVVDPFVEVAAMQALGDTSRLEAAVNRYADAIHLPRPFPDAALREQEPGETLRAALTKIEAWTRDAKGISRPTLRDLLALIHDTARAALEANPQETER